MATTDRALSILRLFTHERPEWTIEAAVRELGLSQSTTYQYFRSLVDAGLLSTYKTGTYVIGPAVIELDRHTRLTDPLIGGSKREMDGLAATLADAGMTDGVVLLCRLYRQTVMCVDQRTPDVTHEHVSYERGRPMPLERGAASRVILANLAPRVLRRFYQQTYGEKMPPEHWAEFRRPLRSIRKAGVSITRGELDAGRIGVSSAIFASEKEVVGSIGVVLTSRQCSGENPPEAITAAVIAAADTVSAQLRT